MLTARYIRNGLRGLSRCQKQLLYALVQHPTYFIQGHDEDWSLSSSDRNENELLLASFGIEHLKVALTGPTIRRFIHRKLIVLTPSRERVNPFESEYVLSERGIAAAQVIAIERELNFARDDDDDA